MVHGDVTTENAVAEDASDLVDLSFDSLDENGSSKKKSHKWVGGGADRAIIKQGHELLNSQEAGIATLPTDPNPPEATIESGNSTIGNIANDTEEEIDPCLVIQVSLLDLIPVDSSILNTGLILSDASNHHEFLIVRKSPETGG